MTVTSTAAPTRAEHKPENHGENQRRRARQRREDLAAGAIEHREGGERRDRTLQDDGQQGHHHAEHDAGEQRQPATAERDEMAARRGGAEQECMSKAEANDKANEGDEGVEELPAEEEREQAEDGGDSQAYRPERAAQHRGRRHRLSSPLFRSILSTETPSPTAPLPKVVIFLRWTETLLHL
jgi:hypothetical protein